MNKVKFLWTLVVMIMGISVHAQTILTPGYCSWSDKKEGLANLAVGSNISLPAIDKTRSGTDMREKNSSAKLYLKLDVGDDYVKINGEYSVKITLQIRSNGNPISGIQQATVMIDEHNPEALKIVDLAPAISTVSPPVSVQVVSITDANNNALNLPAGLLANYITNNLRLTATFVRTYAVDVRLLQGGAAVLSNAVSILPVTLVPESRKATFHWQPTQGSGYSNYEIQLLKLENNSKSLEFDQDQIQAQADWGKALKIETQSYRTDFSLTIAEGTGFYIWRVRPVGNYFEGGIANSENYGQWSYAGASTAVVYNKNALNQASAPSVQTPYAFYFSDPDEKINWIYSRTFTEADQSLGTSTGPKVSEQISYADGLQRMRQTQVFNSSNNTTLVTQSINDFSGRPALSTLPVPVEGALNGYKLDFVKNSAGELYTAADFDDISNVNTPSKIKDDGTDFSYYSNNSNSLPAGNANVPDAEGYPFKRTVFKTDGSGRVTEESGVGATHALGTQHTTRILYSTPSDDELIRIFGDEAPLAESVIKTTTIDANNTASVEYTSKEGKTIATALISESTGNLGEIKNAGEPDLQPLLVHNIANQNVISGGKIVSSRRITISADNTPVTLDYTLSSMPAMEECVNGDCNYKLRFFIINIAKELVYVSDADNTSNGFQSFDVHSGHLDFPANSELRLRGAGNPLTIPITGGNTIALNAGEYVFIKEVYSTNDEQAITAMNNDNDASFQVIFDVISNKMKAVKGTTDYTSFLAFMNTLKTKFDNYNNPSNTQAQIDAIEAEILELLELTRGSEPTDDLPATYHLPKQFTFDPIPVTPSTTTELSFSTGCCGTLKAQLPKPDICYVCDGKPEGELPAAGSVLEMNTINQAAFAAGNEATFGFNNIMNTGAASSETDKKTALYGLIDHYFILPLTDKLTETGLPLYKVAPGFSLDGIKYMLYNMLISKYETSSIINDNGTWYRSKQDENGQWVSTGVLAGPPATYNYKCKENILECWTKALNLLNSFEVDDDVNVIDSFNSQDGDNSAQNEADDEDNYEEMSKRQKRKLSSKVSEAMEEFNNSDDGKVPKARIEALTSLMGNFMDCAGYQFAAIIDGGDLPPFVVDADGDKIPDEFAGSTENNWSDVQTTPATALSYMHADVTIYPNVSAKIQTFTAPSLFKLDGNGNVIAYDYECGSDAEKILYYPYIIKPEWMFKYFMYNTFRNNESTDFLLDKNVQVPNQVLLDMQSCYEPLPVNYLTNTPTGSPCKSCDALRFHTNWSASEKLTFYKRVSGAPACWKNKGIEGDFSTGLPDCASKGTLVAEAKQQLEDVLDACMDKRAEIKEALINELLSSCYKIVNCGVNKAANELTEKEVELMVTAAIEKCTLQIQNIMNKLPVMDGEVCTVAGTLPYGCDNLTDQYPTCVQTECYEFVLTKDNTLKAEDNRKITGKLFPDCDKKIIDIILNGTFLPSIPPYGTDCTTVTQEEWQNPACSTSAADCDNRVLTCPGNTQYKTYSSKLTVNH